MSDSCDPMDRSLPGSPVHGILQARVLEWVAISFSVEYNGRFLRLSGSTVFFLDSSSGSAVCITWSNYFIPLNLSFIIYKMGINNTIQYTGFL